MRKNKGFTLIELLAVIIILAVIALIAIPIIMNVIHDAKKGAAKDAMYGYVKAVELAGAKQVSSITNAPSGTYTTKDGNLVKGMNTLNISFKGSIPKNNGTVTLMNGTVIEARLIFDNIEVSYDGKKTELGNIYQVGGEVYFDPTGAVEDCKAGKEWTLSNTKTTCYKWNVIKDNGGSIEMLLDHNTTVTIAWNGGNSNANGPFEVYNKLKIDTANWNRVETLTNMDNVIRDNGSGGTYTINYNGMKARIISAQEIADIGNDKDWTSDKYTGKVYSNASWLYKNTTDNEDNSNFGYWTDTSRQSITQGVWYVTDIGRLNYSNAGNDITNGIRPVVRVLKSDI